MKRVQRSVLINVRSSLLVVAAAAGIGSTPRAIASQLNPGDTQFNPALLSSFPFFTPNYVQGPLAAAPAAQRYDIFVTSSDFPYNYNGTPNNAFAGFVVSTVWKNADGQLAFQYVFNNLAPPKPQNPPLTEIVRATINDPSDPWRFNPATGLPFTIYAAGSDPSSGGHSTPINGTFGGWSDGVPFDITRSSIDYGVAVEFNPLNSGTQLNSTPNDQSATVWFATDATGVILTDVSLSQNGNVGTAEAFAPGPFMLPEPSTLVLAAIGCCGGLAIRRGRLKRD